jgi:hypothetical protein
VAVRLAAKYARQEFYSHPQVALVAEGLKISADLEYCLLLFVNPGANPHQQEPDEIRLRRASLYRYFDPNITQPEIEANHYWKILNVGTQKVPGGHTPIGANMLAPGFRTTNKVG